MASVKTLGLSASCVGPVPQLHPEQFKPHNICLQKFHFLQNITKYYNLPVTYLFTDIKHNKTIIVIMHYLNDTMNLLHFQQQFHLTILKFKRNEFQPKCKMKSRKHYFFVFLCCTRFWLDFLRLLQLKRKKHLKNYFSGNSGSKDIIACTNKHYYYLLI